MFFNVFLFGSDARRSTHVQPNRKTRHRASSCQPLSTNGGGILQRREELPKVKNRPGGVWVWELRVPFSDFHRPRWASFLNILKSREPQTHPWKRYLCSTLSFAPRKHGNLSASYGTSQGLLNMIREVRLLSKLLEQCQRKCNIICRHSQQGNRKANKPSSVVTAKGF